LLLLTCPNCGTRNVDEFAWGGEWQDRPEAGEQLPERPWAEYLYMRDNPAGLTREWWCHRGGCGEWFLAERDTRTDRVVRTRFAGEGTT